MVNDYTHWYYTQRLILHVSSHIKAAQCVKES